MSESQPGCEGVRRALSERPAGRSGGAIPVWVAQHLAKCEACREAWVGERAQVEAFREATERRAALPAFERVAGAVDERLRGGRRRTARLAWGFGAAALAGAVAALVLLAPAGGAGLPEDAVRVTSASGLASWMRDGEWTALSAEATTLRAGDVVETGSDGAVTLTRPGVGEVEVGPGTRVVLASWTDEAVVMRLERGRLTSQVDHRAPGERFEIVTPAARVAVVGTRFVTRHEAGRGTTVEGLSGVVRVYRAGGALAGEVRRGERLDVPETQVGAASAEAPRTVAAAPTIPAETPRTVAVAPAIPAETPRTVAIAPATPAEAPRTVAVAPATPAANPRTVAVAPATPVEAPRTVAAAPATPAESPRTVAVAPATPEKSPRTVAVAPATPAEAPQTVAAAPATPAESPRTVAVAPATPVESPRTAAVAPATPAEAPRTVAVAPATPVEAPRAQLDVARRELAAGRTGAAISALRAGLDTAPTFETWALLGDAYLLAGRAEDAVEAYASAVAVTADADPGALIVDLGETELALGHVTRARAIWGRYLDRFAAGPTAPRVAARLADLEARAGNDGAAEPLWRLVLTRIPDAPEGSAALAELGRRSLARRDYAGAAALFSTHVDAPPGRRAEIALVGLMHARAGEGRGAEVIALAARYRRDYPRGARSAEVDALVAATTPPTDPESDPSPQK